MEIKILCECGTKFKFDVEPVNGRMPAPVNCPACGADATPQANSVIESTAAEAPAQPLETSPTGLRINRPSAPPPESLAVEAGGGPAPFRAPPQRITTARAG